MPCHLGWSGQASLKGWYLSRDLKEVRMSHVKERMFLAETTASTEVPKQSYLAHSCLRNNKEARVAEAEWAGKVEKWVQGWKEWLGLGPGVYSREIRREIRRIFCIGRHDWTSDFKRIANAWRVDFVGAKTEAGRPVRRVLESFV